jgi:DNA end-binding protein Ku
MAGDAFAVMRDGMAGKVGVGKLALYGREYLVAVRPHGMGIVMHTLHHAAEIRRIEAIEELHAVPAAVKPEEIKLARQVIGTFEQPLDLATYRDEYREGLQKIIDAKIAGQEIVSAATPEAPPRVVNLMDALKKSLDAVSAQKKKPAKAAAAAAVEKSAATQKRRRA